MSELVTVELSHGTVDSARGRTRTRRARP
jgi:hypothetical protein